MKAKSVDPDMLAANREADWQYLQLACLLVGNAWILAMLIDLVIDHQESRCAHHDSLVGLSTVLSSALLARSDALNLAALAS
jgi:hypothetical protein